MEAWRLHWLWLSSSLSLLSWISTWSQLGLWIRSKEAEAWRCPNLPDVVLWIFFRNSLSNSLRNINKLLVQLRNYPSTTKSYFYTFATFSTERTNKRTDWVTLSLLELLIAAKKYCLRKLRHPCIFAITKPILKVFEMFKNFTRPIDQWTKRFTGDP